MDFETVTAEDFGRALTGLGLNILVRDVRRSCAFLTKMFEMEIHRQSDDFAIVAYGEQVFQLHADHTDHSHPLPSLLPEAGPRGGGLESPHCEGIDWFPSHKRPRAAGQKVAMCSGRAVHTSRKKFTLCGRI